VDYVGVSDPICIIHVRDSPTDGWKKFGQTEMMKNNLNPNFEKNFTINYYFERH